MTNPAEMRSATLLSAGLLALFLTILAACGPSGGTEPPVNGDTSVTVTVSGPGRVVQGAFACTGSCTWTGTAAEPVTFQAVPSSGNVLVAWGGVCPVLADDCTRTFEDGDEIAVTFAPHALRLDLTGDGEGQFRVAAGPVNVTCDGDCGVAVDRSLPLQLAVQYEAAGTSGTELGAWSGACASATLDDYCLVTASGATNVGKTWLHPPVAVPDAYATKLDTVLTVPTGVDPGVLANDRDTDGDLLTAVLVDDVANGTLTLEPDGAFVYRPDPGFAGRDDFRYRVRDAFGNTDEADVTIDVTNAILSLVKAGTFNDLDSDGFADVGETIDYSFTITNIGNVLLTGITLDDPLIDVTGGTLASLPVDAINDTAFTGSYTITQADIDAGQVQNTATADSDESPPDTDTVTVDLAQNPVLSFSKTGAFNDLDSDGFADVGETIDYTFTITNTGNVTLTGITLDDPLIGDTGGTLASLAPGATDTDTFSGSHTITQADIDASQVQNTATADSDQTDPTSDTHTQPLPQNPVLDFAKTGTFVDEDSDGFADVGETIDYTFTITNTGNVTLTGITVDDPLIGDTGGTLASLAPGATDTDTFSGSHTITQADIDASQVQNTATADSDQTDPTSDTHTQPLTEAPTL